MTEIAQGTFTPAMIDALLGEYLRGELARIIAEQDAGSASDDASIDARIADLQGQRRAMQRQARRNDFSAMEAPLAATAERVNLTVPNPITPELGRRAIDLARAILDVEAQMLDGDEARDAAAGLVSRYSDAGVEAFVAAPTLLSAVIAKTFALHPKKSMKGNIEAIANLALLYFGDVPITAIDAAAQTRFFAWMSRLPRAHGKRHGKNRYWRDVPKDPAKFATSKDDEIAAADAADEEAMQAVRGMNDLSITEKRAVLSERLTPRLTMTTMRRNRDGLNRIFKAAQTLGCKTVPKALSYKEIAQIVEAEASEDPLYVRVTQPKIRMPWTEERLSAFLTSPLFTGCSSEYRRWRRGDTIVRDALYWVPLILLTIGSRIEEILVLKRRNLVYRDATYCLAIGLDPDQAVKNVSSERVVPIPQLLLDLGFVEWVHHLPENHGPLLFPDAVRRSVVGDITGPFSKALNRILDRLGLGDFDEDLYAMRKTLSSLLRREGVEEGQRQAIAGHKHGSVLNRHYTAHHAKDLKAAVDKADFQLTITFDPRRGFPTIARCGLSKGELVKVDVTLDEAGEAATILVRAEGRCEPVFQFDRIDRSTGESLGYCDIRSAARKFRDLLHGRSMQLPKQVLKRNAVEHFQALA